MKILGIEDSLKNSKIDLRKQIEKYIPYNEQEEVDRFFFLQFMTTFEDVLTRNNVIGHFSSSAFVLNKARDKMIVVHHNQFDTFVYPGGHADGNPDLYQVAVQEVAEETGAEITPIKNNFVGLQNIAIQGHMKKGKYVSSHLHFNVVYLFESDETKPLKVKPDENSIVKWMPIEEVLEQTTSPFMKAATKKLVKQLEEGNYR